MKSRTIVATLLLFLATTMASAADASKIADANAAFAHIKSLAGEWEAKNAAGGKSHLRYEVVSGGSAVVEHFEDDSMGATNAMVTVYYLDGGQLLLTHYCMAKNQPRMQAQGFDAAGGDLRFTFLDATGLPSPEAGHMHNASFHFVDQDHFTSAWQYFEGGKPKMTESAPYVRVR